MTTASAQRAYRFHEIEGPISPFRHSFILSLEKQGFNRRSIHCQLRVVAKFSDWLHHQKVLARKITPEHQIMFFSCQQGQHYSRQGYVKSVCRLLDHLGSLQVIPACQSQVKSYSPVDIAVSDYAQYLRHKVGISELSITKYCPFVKDFLLKHADGVPSLGSEIKAADVMRYFTRLASTASISQAKSAATAIRSYLKYLNCIGHTRSDLVGAVPTVPNWSLNGIPRSISAAHVRQVLDHCPRHTAIGLRDFAILLMLAQLGLRSSEVVSLTLDSIDWDNSSLSFVGKGSQSAELPLTSDVGEALANYLKHGRPNCHSRALFISGVAPMRGLGSPTTVATIVRTAIRRAGIQTTSHGSHQFRHALASSMMNGGATLDEIGSVLRHRKAKTTRLYAKVDIDSLRKLCLPLPGEDQ
jgi:integrase/recombinase XerD